VRGPGLAHALGADRPALDSRRIPTHQRASSSRGAVNQAGSGPRPSWSEFGPTDLRATREGHGRRKVEPPTAARLDPSPKTKKTVEIEMRRTIFTAILAGLIAATSIQAYAAGSVGADGSAGTGTTGTGASGGTTSGTTTGMSNGAGSAAAGANSGANPSGNSYINTSPSGSTLTPNTGNAPAGGRH
jgi:hypothetical protein